MNYLIVAIFIGILSVTTMAQDTDDCQIIRKIDYPLTKKQSIKTTKKIALLNTCLKDEPPMQRPTIGVVRNGKTVYRTFGIIKLFGSKKEARIYAKENKITDIRFSR